MKMLVILSVLAYLACTYAYNVDVLMPDVSPKATETYLCHSFKLDPENPIYITEFIPRSTMDIAHHMLLFGCDEPGFDEPVWNCGEMNSKTQDDRYKPAPVCRGSQQSIIYAWAMNAPKLVLPQDVAFKIGGHTKVKYLVLQVHYADVQKFLDGGVDDSGVTMVAQSEPVSKVAGVLLLNTAGYIKAQTTDYFEVACQITENVVMHPFAYRVHAHKLGIVNSGYRVTTDKTTGTQEWTEIGRRSPQLPQMFYPATNKVPVQKGDIVAARCTMYNFLDRDVFIGSTGNDEMCNFYMMYYVDGDRLPEQNVCTSGGPPHFYFENFQGRLDGQKLDVSAVPKEASEAPITNEKPAHHGAEQHTMNNEKPAVQPEHEHHVEQPDDNNSESDEDVEELERLEKELLARKLVNKMIRQYSKTN